MVKNKSSRDFVMCCCWKKRLEERKNWEKRNEKAKWREGIDYEKPIFYPFKHLVTMICNKHLVISLHIHAYVHTSSKQKKATHKPTKTYIHFTQWVIFSLPKTLYARQPNNCYFNIPNKWKNERTVCWFEIIIFPDRTRFS